jgi:integrase
MVFKLPEVITEEELMKVLKVTKQAHHRAAFCFGFYECMRISEIVNLKEENINRSLKLLKIKQAKGSKDRNIPIMPEIMKYLKHIPMKCGIRALQLAWNEKTKEALGHSRNFHILRHSGITHYLVKRKWDGLQVQRLAGHSKIATTQIYTHINPTDLVEKAWEDQ